MRWPDTDGAPICPHCSCAVVYTYRCRRLFKCKAVFLVLAAQYESWSMPFMVLLSVPLALFGAVLALRLRDMQLDVYSEIGLVMLIGLAAKNAILIVEFAKQLRERGAGIVEAAMEAGRLRLRPILMTAFAFILGSLPLMVASGAGAGSRQSIGTTVVGGMLAGTILGLALVPVLYAVIERLREGRISSGVPSADQGRFKGAAGD
jgi:HAE1 family hydrophobic/amphiphilic exporter-1